MPSLSNIGVNEVNYFPNFKPMASNDPRWEKDATHCMECQQEFHFILKQKQHCTVCGITFCKTCCHSQKVYNGHVACGGCVANAMMMIKTRYDDKRKRQVQQHFETHHKDEADEKKAHDAHDDTAASHHQKSDVDDLYGRAFEALLQLQEVSKSGAQPQERATSNHTTVSPTGTIGINEVNFFPNFTPCHEGDERWENGSVTHCLECQKEFHAALNRPKHCTVCGHIFCSFCCSAQRLYNGHHACGGCVTSGMMMINNRYKNKRDAQLKAHVQKHHKTDAVDSGVCATSVENDLYGKHFDSLMMEVTDNKYANSQAGA